MNALDIALALVGGTLLLIGLTVGLLKHRLWMSGPLVAFGIGVAAGPLALDLFAAHMDVLSTSLLEHVARLTIAVAIMEGALRLPDRYMRDAARTVGLLVFAVMLLMWGASAGAGLLLLGLSPLSALLFGAIVTPTDPVVSSTLVTGTVATRDIPERLRNALTAESIANDSLAFPLMMLPLVLLTDGSWTRDWLVHHVLWGVLGGGAMGAALGWATARALSWSIRRSLTDEASVLTIGLSLALFTLGVVELAGAEGLFGVLAAGLVFRNQVDDELEWEEERIQEAVTRFFVLPVFVLFGVVAPWEAWSHAGVGAFAAAALLPVLRRLPFTLAIGRWMPAVHRRADAALVGTFGPVGVAALFYACLARRQLHDERIWTASTLVVLVSLIMHSVAATPLARVYARRTGRRRDDNR